MATAREFFVQLKSFIEDAVEQFIAFTIEKWAVLHELIINPKSSGVVSELFPSLNRERCRFWGVTG